MLKLKFSDNHLVRSVLLAFSILLFHVLLIAAVGLLIIIFRGIVNYLVWILLGGGLLAGAGFFVLYKYMQKEKSILAKMLQLPEFKNRRVEVNILGGLASFKIDQDDQNQSAIDTAVTSPTHQLDDPDSQRVRELTELARLFEKDLISIEEYDRAKDALLNP